VGEAVIKIAPELSPSGRTGRGRFSAWFRTLGRVRKAIRRAGGLVEQASDALEACERRWTARPRLARRHLRRASKAVRKADELRGRALVGLSVAGGEAAQVPGETVRVTKASISIVQTSLATWVRLDEMMKRVEEASAALGVGDGDNRPPVPKPAWPIPPRRFLARWSRSVADRILALFKRRQRRTTAAPADAPRRVSRGRAPPSVAGCSL